MKCDESIPTNTEVMAHKWSCNQAIKVVHHGEIDHEYKSCYSDMWPVILFLRNCTVSCKYSIGYMKISSWHLNQLKPQRGQNLEFMNARAVIHEWDILSWRVLHSCEWMIFKFRSFSTVLRHTRTMDGWYWKAESNGTVYDWIDPHLRRGPNLWRQDQQASV